MVYIGNHYGPEWFITKKDLKGLYIRFSSYPLERPRVQIDKSELVDLTDWKKPSARETRLLIKLLFKHLKRPKRP